MTTISIKNLAASTAIFGGLGLAALGLGTALLATTMVVSLRSPGRRQ